MNRNTYIRQIIAALFLGLLCFPAASQYVHVLDLHEHEVCLETDLHMHEILPDCELDDLRLPVFDRTVLTVFEEPIVFEQQTVIYAWQERSIGSSILTPLGRAPPLA